MLENLGNMRCFRGSQRLALYQGTTLSRAVKTQTELGFTGCRKTLVFEAYGLQAVRWWEPPA